MISIILPAYNAASTIHEAVASVLSQESRTPFELIAIDDGSTDGTRDTLEALDDPRLQVHHQSNRGPSATRNRGLALAKGEFVAWIDADDVWSEGKLERQTEALRQCPEAAVAYGWVDYHDRAGRFLGPDLRATFTGDVYEEILLRNFISCGSNTVMRKAAIVDFGGFDESLSACEDWDLHVRLASRFPFVCVPAVVVRYRLSGTSLTSQLRLMETAHGEASSRLFATAPLHLQAQRAQCDARFLAYLAVRSVESGKGWRGWITALRFFGRSLRKSPGLALALHRSAFVRGMKTLKRRLRPPLTGPSEPNHLGRPRRFLARHPK